MRNSRRTLAVAAVALLTLVAFAGTSSAKVSKGDRAAEFSGVKDGKNHNLKLSAYRGKVVVLTFGASWCKPCGKELPAYEALARKYAKANAAVQFVAVNIDSDHQKAVTFVKQSGLKTVKVGFDQSSSTVDKYEPGTMPTTYIIDGKGIVREVHAGFEKGDEEEIAKLVDGLL